MDLLSMMQENLEVLDQKQEEAEEASEKKKEEALRQLDERALRRAKKKEEKRQKKREERIAKKQKMQRRRKEAVQELFTTELTYVKNLMLLNNGFIKPLTSASPPVSVDPSDVSVIFSNVNMIGEFHKEMLKAIKEKSTNWTPDSTIGEVLERLVPFLKMYSTYAASYEKGIKRVQELCESNAAFGAWIEECAESPMIGGQRLGAFLILPIQRVPRYRLLTQVILENTEEKHEDHALLSGALKQITEIADHINTAVTERANLVRLLELQQIVGGDALVEPGRKLLMDGRLKTNYFDKRKASAFITGGSPKPSKRSNSQRQRMRTTTLSSRSPDLRRQLMDNSGKSPAIRTLSLADLRKASGYHLPGPSSLSASYVILCNDVLVFAKATKKGASETEDLGTVWVKHDNLMPEESFFVVSLRGCSLVYCESPTSRREWVAGIEDATKKVLDASEKKRAYRDKLLCQRQDDGWAVSYASSSSPSMPLVAPMSARKRSSTSMRPEKPRNALTSSGGVGVSRSTGGLTPEEIEAYKAAARAKYAAEETTNLIDVNEYKQRAMDAYKKEQEEEKSSEARSACSTSTEEGSSESGDRDRPLSPMRRSSKGKHRHRRDGRKKSGLAKSSLESTGGLRSSLSSPLPPARDDDDV